MCKFCYKLGENKKEVVWNVRSCCADQNIEDYNEEPAHDGKHRQIEKEWFELKFYKNKDKDEAYVSVEYRMETSDGFIINPFSEAIQWSFCPFCGNQISKSVKQAEEIYTHQLDIEDEDYDIKDYL